MTKHSLGGRMMALLLIFALALGCMPASAATKKSTVALKKSAALYKSASTKSKKLMNVSQGASVTVISSKGKWKRVEVAGKRGYMLKSAFAVTTAAAEPKATPKPTAKAKATKKPKKAPKSTATPASGSSKIVAAPSVPDGQAATSKAKGTTMLTQQPSKLYNKPKTSSKCVQVGEGMPVSVRSQGSKWSRVSVDGKSGYMLTSAFQQTVKQKSKLYKSSSTKSSAVTLSKGAKVSILSVSGDWIKVKRGGRTGYLLSSAFEAAASATPAPAPADDGEKDVRKTTVKSALYQKPSSSSKHTSVKKGTSVTVLSDDGSWLKVKIGSKSGYMPQKAFAEAATATPAPAASDAPGTSDSYKKLKAGSKGASVKNLQIRLEDLGYLDSVPNSRFDAGTVAAVKLFQSASGLKKNGVADNKTQQALYASSAVRSPIQSASMRKGNKSAQVKRLQARLSAKGYYKSRKNGSYADSTVEAVKMFQRQVGLSADGVAGRNTLSKLFSSGAPAASDAPVATPTPGPTVKPTAEPSGGSAANTAPPMTASKKKKADEVIAFAMSQLGKPYVFGSNGPNSWDCSGFTAACYAQVGISLPHSAYLQGYNYGTKVSYSQLQRGDLISWNTVSDGDLSDHVGIYLGNNQAIHASSGYGKVIISPTNSGYYQRVFSWGRALL